MTDNTINPAGFNQAGTMPNLSPEQIAKLKEAQAKKIEAIKKVKEMLEKTQKECEPFKKEILEKFKKKTEVDKIIIELGKKKLKDLKVVTALHDEIWDMALKGKYDFISTLAMSASIYDNNFLG